MNVLAFVAAFVLGRFGSLWLYQAGWKNGKSRRFPAGGALAAFLARPWPWLAHIPVLWLSFTLDWHGMPQLRGFACLGAGAFALAAVGRWGAADLGRYFWFDRFLVLALWAGLWFSPVCLYPLLLAGCCLQYIVSGWPLQPGYSNLLGFEFMRGTICHVCAGLLVAAGLRALGHGLPDPEAMILAVALCGQAAGYVAQALAKCALGKRWYAWILENRLQCLVVNAWLRGWGEERIGLDGILRLARWISRFRVPLCAAVWAIEIGWLFILADARLALALLAATAVFHLAVWLLTGLSGYHYALSHAWMASFAASLSAAEVFRPAYAWAGAGCILANALWVLPLRRRVFRAFARDGSAGPWARCLDPADHLMSWWDGPYMRMYSYSVRTASGRRYRFPVTRFSPYDTFMTDIHTHLMILGRDWDLDPGLAADRALARAGVWGLTVSLTDRDRVYGLMDDPAADLAGLDPDAVARPAAEVGAVIVGNAGKVGSEAGRPLADFFAGLNRCCARKGFRLLLRWPHFPGEDRVPDWSPLAGESLPDYDGSEPVSEVECHCVKTFYRGGSIELMDERVFARIRIEPLGPESMSGSAGAVTRRRKTYATE
jgi:hypothetical protein